MIPAIYIRILSFLRRFQSMQFLVSLVTIIFGAFFFAGVDGFNGNVLGYTA